MATDRSTIEAYNRHAAAWSERIRSGKNYAHEYLEKPAMQSVMPNVKGKAVLCLGCGSGEECEPIIARGAKSVIGIDASKELIALAREKGIPSSLFFVRSMENLGFASKKFDIVYSSLTIHYVKDWRPTLREVYRVLKPGGTFVFSTHHPIKWGALAVRTQEAKKFTLGYQVMKNTGECEVFGDYLNTRKITDTWFDDFTVSFYHKPLGEIIREIISSGFEIVDFLEPKAVSRARKKDLAFWEAHQKIPTFMIFSLKRPVK